MTDESTIDWKARYERELRMRRRDEKGHAKTNIELAALRKALRTASWDARRYKTMYEQSRIKQVQIMRERLALIAEIASVPTDDWIANAPEPKTADK